MARFAHFRPVVIKKIGTPAFLIPPLILCAGLAQRSAFADPELKPGFKIILTTSDARTELDDDGFMRMDTIFAEVNPDQGVVFHLCASRDGADAPPPLPSEKCSTLGNALTYVPVDDLLKRASGTKHILLTILKAATGIGVIATTNLSYAFVQPAAQTVNALWNPQPMEALQRDHRLSGVLRDTLMLAGKTEGTETIPTRVLPGTFEELKNAIHDIEVESFNDLYREMTKRLRKNPNDVNLQKGLAALKMERSFNDWGQAAYSRAHEKTAPTETKPAP